MGLAYERVGTGPPLVLLHGVGHRRQAWGAVLGLLAPHREVILVDLPGHGESPPLRLGGRTPIEAMMEEVIALFDELGLDRPHVAGNSLGGALALVAGARGRAATVTALSPGGFWANARQYRYAKAVFALMEIVGDALQPVAPTLARTTPGRAVLYAAAVSRPSKMSPRQARGDAVAFHDARAGMNAVLSAPVSFTASIPGDVPVTIAWGTKDRLLSPRQALVARQRLPQARYVALPGCGHVPMTDDPPLVARVLLDGSARPGDTGPAVAGQQHTGWQ